MAARSDIHSARARIAPHILSTPVTFDERLGVWIKWESHQHTRSFKPRGALNKVLGLSPAELERGLLCASAGNHGQSVALAAQKVGGHVTVYVPESAPQIKIEKMLALSAEVVRVPGFFGDAEAAAICAAREQGKTFVSPYNDWQIILGAGTLGLDLAEQCPQADRWLVPVGGGGLIMGMVIAAPPGVSVIGVQSEASAFLYEEFHHRDMSGVVEMPSLGDGLAGAVEPGSVTIEGIHTAADVRLVTEPQIAEAIAYAYHIHGEVVEGSGAVVLAAVLSGQLQGEGRTALAITGGNIDPDKHRMLCEAYPASLFH